jgi:DNA topoisomerase-1
VNLDSKGHVRFPKVPPLLTDLECPKCEAALNLRRGAKGPWLSCSKFPKCKGRRGWVSLPEEIKAHWEKALEAHEAAHPQPVIRTLDGSPVPDDYEPKLLKVEAEQEEKTSL